MRTNDGREFRARFRYQRSQVSAAYALLGLRTRALAVEVDVPITGERAIGVPARLTERRTVPTILKSDDSAEFTSDAMFGWSVQLDIDLHSTKPGRRCKLERR
jgi:hypothetical protein